MDKVTVLFYVFIFLFLCTGLITLLGLIKKVDIEKKYLGLLFSALSLELGGAVIYLFSSTEFFAEPSSEGIIVRNELPTDMQQLKSSELLNILNKYLLQVSQLKMLEESLDKLKTDLDLQVPSYQVTTIELDKTRVKLNEINIQYNESKVYKDKYLQLQRLFLVRMANLNSAISIWGPSVNFDWKPDEKKEIALMLQEALKRIKFMETTDTPNDDPAKARELLIAYQQSKNFKVTGFLTSEVIAFIIRDYLKQSTAHFG